MKVTRMFCVVLFMLGMIQLSDAQTSNKDLVSKEEAIQLMEKFRDGYIKRDSTQLDSFVEMFTDDIVYIGVASHEFFRGKKSVRKLTYWDWKRWFDLRRPVDKIVIRTNRNAAWFAVVAASGPWRNGNTYEIRIVGSMEKEEGKLKFKQICFSYPAPLKIIEK